MLARFYLFITSKSLTAQLVAIAIAAAIGALTLLVAYSLGAKWYIFVAVGAMCLGLLIYIAWRGELKTNLKQRKRKLKRKHKSLKEFATKSSNQYRDVPPQPPGGYTETARQKSSEDTVPVPIATVTREPDVNTVHTQRNNIGWLFMIRHIWKRTLLLLVAVPLFGWLIFGLGVITGAWAADVYIFGLFVAVLLYIFDFKREKFRKRHTECYVQGDSLIFEYPDSFWFGFGGGQSSLMIDRIDTVDIDPRKWLRKIFWRNLRNMTINAPGEHDKVFNNLTDLKNAEEIKAAIKARKYSINH